MITREEYGRLNIYRSEGCRWIARDKNKGLYVYTTEPEKREREWRTNKLNSSGVFNDDGYRLFQDIKWEDEKPTKINDLIKEYEAHQVIVGEKVNKTELVKEIEGILDDIAVSDYQLGECDEDTIWTISSITIRKILSAIEKHSHNDAKVKVPSFVADWIKEWKDNLFIFEALSFMPENVKEWVMDNEEISARAWLDGYDVAEESLYYALIKGHELMADEDDWCYWNLSIHDYRLFPSDKYSTRDGYLTKMSKDNWIKMGINDSNADFVKVEVE